MPRAALKLTDKFVSHLNSLDKTRKKVEKLHSEGQLVRRDVEQVYAGLYLDAATSLEGLIEDLFIGLLVGRIHPPSDTILRVAFKSDTVTRDVVFGGRNYVDWLPFHHTEQRAKAFFRNGRPFTCLSKTEKKQVQGFLYVRNAIAHQSAHSQRMFEQEVIGSVPLTRRERTPVGFLRSIFRVAPVQTRYESLVGEMAAVALRICS